MPPGRPADGKLNASGRKREKRKSRLQVPVEPPRNRIIEFKYRGEIETLPTNCQLKVQYVPKPATTEGKCLEKGEPKSSSKTKGKSRPSKKGKAVAALTPSQYHQPGVISKLPEPRFRVLKQATEYYEPANARAPYYRKNANIGEEKDDEANTKIVIDKRKRKGKKRKRSVKKKVETEMVKGDEVKVEYDMDEEDAIWLDKINQKRKSNRLHSVGKNDFEKLMDRLEKESFTQSQHNGSSGPAIDEDAVCCICNDGECQNSNAILFCDMCNLAVHQECYGVPYIPEGQWLCRRCLQSPTRAIDCVLCPNKGGAFKHTDDNRWAHVICALWIPEVCFANTVFLEPIDSICAIPPARWKLVCCVCHQKNAGACIQCHKSNCYVAFHVTCAQQAGLYMKIEAVNEVTPQGINTTVRKLAFCFNHAPASKSGSSNGLYSSGDESKEGKADQKIKDKIKKARKMMAAKRSSSIPVVNIPTIPTETLSALSVGLAFPGRNHFLLRLYAYWRLKRQSRAPALLLRRLQTGNSTMRFDQLLKKDKGKGNKAHKINKIKNYAEKLRRIRYGLEVVRMLTNQIMKRERQKFLLIINRREYQINRLQPFKEFLLFILNKIAEKDVNQFFLEPVSLIDVPNYLKFISEPMDIGTMRHKVEHHQYSSFDAFQNDLRLITDNCKKFNSKDTIWHKAALKLEVVINELLAQHRPLARNYDPQTGTHAHLPDISSSLNSLNSLSH